MSVIRDPRIESKSTKLEFENKHGESNINKYELIDHLNQLPVDQRTEAANKLITHVSHVGHDIEIIVALLPVTDRVDFIKKHFDLIDNPYVFSLVLNALPEEARLDFVNQHYSFFSFKQRRDIAALANILRLIPEKDRYDFACRYGNEIGSSWSLMSVLETLPEAMRIDFAFQHSKSIFIYAQEAIQILSVLKPSDRLKFYVNSTGDYLAFDNLQYALKEIIPTDDINQFLKINSQKMLKTFEMSEAICYFILDVRHPIYYSLQRAFHAIERHQNDKQKLHTYAEISNFFNQYYEVNSKPYNPLQDNQYIYLRQLESKSVSSLIAKATPLPLSCIVSIAQYSGHYFDLVQSQSRHAELKNIPQEDITWNDLVYLHKNTLGLRGITDDDMAVNEEKNGGRGDAISLARFGMGEHDELPYAVLVNEKEMDTYYPQKKAELLQSFQKGMKWHIGICFGFGYSVAFELMSRGDDAIYAYDFGDRYLLGKCGTANFTASQVKKTILRSDAPDWNVELVYRLVVSEIKNMTKTQKKQYNPGLFAPVTVQLSDNHAPKMSETSSLQCCIL